MGLLEYFLYSIPIHPKYTKFNSGYEMDTNNNNLGIKLETVSKQNFGGLYEFRKKY
jgi:hypothetical protein